jgi:hypothetical protein
MKTEKQIRELLRASTSNGKHSLRVYRDRLSKRFAADACEIYHREAFYYLGMRDALREVLKKP